MYWSTNTSSPPSTIDTVLTKQDLNLGELLDHENILQDLKSQNQKLIEFITRSDVLNDLVSLVIQEPSQELEEVERYRRPNLACEVLTTDIPRLNESLSEKDRLQKLFSFFESDPPLNPLLASFVSRTLSLLISRKVDQHWYSYQFTCLKVLEFLKSTENSSQLLLKHLGTSAIMDLILKLLTQIEGDNMQQNLLDWLESVHLVENIVALFHPSVDADRQYNAAQLLCDTIRKLRSKDSKDLSKPEPILNCIQSPMIIRKLLGHMLEEEQLSESSIAGGISVLLTLLEPPQPDPTLYNTRGLYNTIENTGSGDPIVSSNPALPTIVSVIVPYLPKLHNLLINPPKKNPIKLACGTIEPPLGNTRLTVIKLISALIATNTHEVNEMLDKLNTVQVLLDLFFRYTWNNFLHTQVEKCLAFALNAPVEDSQQNPLINNIFIKCRLLQRILEAWEDNETEQCKEGGKRRGYMGHLTNIANSIVKQTDEGLGEFLEENIDKDTMVAWKDYVERRLKPIIELQKRCLGGIHPSQNTESDNQSEFNNVVFSNDSTSSQMEFSKKTPNCQISSSNFFDKDLASDSQEEMEKRAKMFDDYCNSRESTLVPWESAFPQFLERRGKEDGIGRFEDLFNEELTLTSSDEDEKEILDDDKEILEDVWSSAFGPPLEEPENPWEQIESVSDPVANEGWANFSSAQIEDQFQAIKLANDVEVNCRQEAEEDSKLKEENLVIPMADKEMHQDVAKKSDNNANLNNFIPEKDPSLHDQELIDNFRFLSNQGMVSETPEVLTNSDNVVVNKSSSDSVPQPAAGDESRKPEAPQDPV